MQAFLCFPPFLPFPPCLPSRTNFRILWTGWTGSQASSLSVQVSITSDLRSKVLYGLRLGGVLFRCQYSRINSILGLKLKTQRQPRHRDPRLAGLLDSYPEPRTHCFTV